jgi:hypothetical protein
MKSSSITPGQTDKGLPSARHRRAEVTINIKLCVLVQAMGVSQINQPLPSIIAFRLVRAIRAYHARLIRGRWVERTIR